MIEAASYTIEPELHGGTPRLVRFRTGTRILRTVLPLFFGGVMALLFGVLLMDGRQDALLLQQGKTAVALVTSKRHTRDSYHIAYDFPWDGRTISGEQTVSEDVYDRTRVGSQVPITYLPSEKNIQRFGVLNKAQVQSNQKTFLLVLSILSLFFVILYRYVDRIFRAQLRLVRIGTPVPGRILSWYWPRNLAGNQMAYCYFTYEYVVPTLGTLQKTVSVGALVVSRLKDQAIATVLYDPQQPQNSHLYAALTAVQLR